MPITKPSYYTGLDFFNVDGTYVVDDYVVFNDWIYRCTVNTTGSEGDPTVNTTDWESISQLHGDPIQIGDNFRKIRESYNINLWASEFLSERLADLQEKLREVYINGGVAWGTASMVYRGEWTASTYYSPGNFVFRPGTLEGYVCIQDHVSGSDFTTWPDVNPDDTLWQIFTPVTKIEVFNSSGTWYKQEGVRTVFVRCIGGGGGGSIYSTNPLYGVGDGYSGGGGALSEFTFNAEGLPSTVDVTVGTGGAGAAYVMPGPIVSFAEDGGDSTFGTFLRAEGGKSGNLYPVEQARGLTSDGGYPGLTPESFDSPYGAGAGALCNIFRDTGGVQLFASYCTPASSTNGDSSPANSYLPGGGGGSGDFSGPASSSGGSGGNFGGGGGAGFQWPADLGCTGGDGALGVVVVISYF